MKTTKKPRTPMFGWAVLDQIDVWGDHGYLTVWIGRKPPLGPGERSIPVKVTQREVRAKPRRKA